MDTTTDVNTLLANVEKTWSLIAAGARSDAARAREGMDDPASMAAPHQAMMMRHESERLAALAATWDLRVAEARRGYLLFSPAESSDLEFTSTYSQLIHTCRDAGRIIYTSEIDAGLNVATSPKPGGPVRSENLNPLPTAPRDYGNPGNRD